MTDRKAPTHYKVSSDQRLIAGICRDFGCTFQEHEHSDVQLSILFRGVDPTLLTHDGAGTTQRTKVLTDSFIFVASGQPHQLGWSEDGEVLHLWMPQESMLQLSEQSRCPIPTSRQGDFPDRAIHGIGRILMEEFDSTGGLAPAMVNHATSLIVARVLRVAERQAREMSTGVLSLRRLKPAIDFITDCPEKDFTLIELAALCNSSVFHFARSFTARVGAAPFTFQRTQRLKKAERLLLVTDLSIEAVGAAVGFENATHFTRMFRRQTGYAPREYRRLRN